MDKPKSGLYFKITVAAFKLRDWLSPRINVLKEANIKPGFSVLDYGCGPGGYIRETAKLVGESGTLYALDIHPLAVQRALKIAADNALTNVKTIQSDCKTSLPDAAIDVVLLYDTFHLLSEPGKVLNELRRILKPNGILSFSDHHMKEAAILSSLTGTGLFKLSAKGKKTYTFIKT
ncbi:MAG: class I SAM-dependent methyltransferase [Sedimentisphaerales bacterium]|nr:class I SAM-dependent methyltransferase [Sedimentisphaerales bacterium]